MCGIAGFLSLNPQYATSGPIVGEAMANAIRHRGPDDSGVWNISRNGYEIVFAHRRLAILDLSSHGHQPMNSSGGRFTIVFNGEIYNHNAIRRDIDELTKINWRGHSDTETLLEGFEKWGIEETIKRASGMFALAVWDHREDELILARDRIGEKPLYFGWTRDKKSFLFASELKALGAFPEYRNEIDRNTLALYFKYLYIPNPFCIYKDTFKLEPGKFLVVSREDLLRGRARHKTYWNLKDVLNNSGNNKINSFPEAVDELESVLRASVQAQTISDVPIGAFLSGGIDSSTIAAIMQSVSARKIQTFTVGFKEKGYDESHFAANVAKHIGTDHHEIFVSPEDARSVIEKLPQIYDEPFADSSGIPTFLISEFARKSVTVALSGDGGDELFGGYNRYVWGSKLWRYMAPFPLRMRRHVGTGFTKISVSQLENIISVLSLGTNIPHLAEKMHKTASRLMTVESELDLYKSLITEWTDEEKIVDYDMNLNVRFMDEDETKSLDDISSKMMFFDMTMYLPDDILTKIDRASMAVSLETRVPFLDPRLIELAWRLPISMKIRNGEGKYILRQVLDRYVPRNLVDRPKSGFTIPIGKWLRYELREWAEDLLNPISIEKSGYINSTIVNRLWHEHQSGKRDWTTRLWSVLMFQSWFKLNHSRTLTAP